jgi:hypothetical protein
MRWVKRLSACKYAGLGRSKLDELILSGLIRAKKEPGNPQAPVYVDLTSIDQFYDSLPDAPLRKSGTAA